MKHSDEHKAFTKLVDRVLSVSRSVVKQRVEEHRKQAAKNPNKPGPKRKAAKPSASARAGGGQP